MANALVVHKNRLSRKRFIGRHNTSACPPTTVIATYAELHKLTIVRTYRDEGESGLKIENRAGLTELIDDVRSGQTDFGHLLIFDVSRWGRFQDIDESAHYEFVCRQAQSPQQASSKGSSRSRRSACDPV